MFRVWNDRGIYSKLLLPVIRCYTRWETHGDPTLRNNHPSSSGAANYIVGAHSSVVTNYESGVKGVEVDLSIITSTKKVLKLKHFWKAGDFF
ncbi:hypothetical protein C5167_028805 [Papaver somniferum]|nr:hypothetical protein C5167_028805 [Papaver somniferum]